VNPATLVDSPQAGRHEITPLSATNARRLIRATHGDRMAARWLVGLALGLRQGEALGLWWDDVDLDAGLLRVRRSLQRQHGGGLVFAEPKTQRSRRTIPLPAPLVEALRQHLADQEKERITAGSLWRDSSCVFTTPIGTPTDPRNEFRQFKKLLARADLPSVRLHDRRPNHRLPCRILLWSGLVVSLHVADGDLQIRRYPVLHL
jgi:integrase